MAHTLILHKRMFTRLRGSIISRPSATHLNIVRSMPQVYVTSLIDMQSLWSHLVSTFARIKAGGAFLVANTMMFIKFCLYTYTHFLLVSVHTTSTNMFLYTHFILGSDGFHLLINTTVSQKIEGPLWIVCCLSISN